ncbi:MAG: 4-hydroxy-tetrahydrodipicolinate synthase [Pseudomonadota bacterium]
MGDTSSNSGTRSIKESLRGSIVALVTPMLADGSIDYEALAELLDWHAEAGTAGIVAVGTTGESATLHVEEHLQVIGFCVERLAGRIPLIAGTGANSTQEAIELTGGAASLGADACLLVTPYYNRPTQRGLFEHFRAIAEAVDVAQILYNVPSRTAVDMSNETTLRLAALNRIVGIKDATGDVARGRALLSEAPGDFAVYSGDDGTAAELILAGASGNISVTANVVPERVAAVCRSALDGDVQRTHELNGELAALNDALFVEANPMPVKYALAKLGKIRAGIRLPMTWTEGEAAAVVDAALAALTS